MRFATRGHARYNAATLYLDLRTPASLESSVPIALLMSESCSLKLRHCLPCEGGIPPLTPQQTHEWLQQVDGWQLSEDGKSIFRKLTLKHFVEAVTLLNQIADISEREQHHPDLHLTGYRKLRIDLTTHAIDGLSENDFILAAKIDDLIGPT